VPKDAIISLRTSYALLGESWAMNESEFKNIVRGAQNFSKYAAVDDESLHSFFLVLDSDENGLIDSLEFLAVIALISGIFAHIKNSHEEGL
jgi:Ca2+-binding EF-hand superfamily protein